MFDGYLKNYLVYSWYFNLCFISQINNPSLLCLLYILNGYIEEDIGHTMENALNTARLDFKNLHQVK